MGRVRVAVVGAGDRGKDRYGAYGIQHPEKIDFVAVAEPIAARRKAFQKQHGIGDDLAFETWKDLMVAGLALDGVIIATQDDMHFEPTKAALELGYDVLLEKPMSNTLEETIALGELAKKHKNTFMICHVLRYTPFYSRIKAIIESGQIGQVMSIQHNENIGYYHMAHSFVRGNWRNKLLSSPIILAKSCHDMDLLLWLAGDRCKKVTSYGSLSHFKADNQPKAASDRCLTCACESECPYSSKKLYYKHIGTWPTTVITENQTTDGVTQALQEGPYGRCVYKCDNDVCDHQVTILEFESGLTATFNLSAFTEKTNRTIKVMGTLGEIRGDDRKNAIEVKYFGRDQHDYIEPRLVAGGHGGGDTGIMEDFIALLEKKPGQALTSAEISVESHVLAFAADASRQSNTSVVIEDFYKDNL